MKRKHILYIALFLCIAASALAWQLKGGGKTISNAEFVGAQNIVQAQKATPQTVTLSQTALPEKEKTINQTTTPETTAVFSARETYGVIGSFEGKESDNPQDNIFRVTLKEKPQSTDRVWLVYELNGVSSGSGVSKSVNDRPASGGYLTALHNGWTAQREPLNPAWTNQGVNRILFTLPANASYGYAVRNVRIEVEKATTQANTLVAQAVTLDNKTYLHGFVAGGVTRVTAGDTELVLFDGEFEGVIPAQADITLTAHNGNEPRATQKITSALLAGKADFTRPMDKHIASASKSLTKGKAAELQLAGGKLTVDNGTLLKNNTLSVTALRDVDLPALDYGMTNVTARNEGYRFLPHGTHFADKGAKVSLAYDRTRIPSGYTEDDIRTYYFDTETNHWVALQRDSVDRKNNLIVSATTHFTDMINGVIKAPESPQTEGFAPTMMNDIKAADPTAKLNVIAPPSANQRGSADVDYALEMPPARNGMAPSLGIRYSSEGGSGWLGEGWNLSIPGIAVDTRWGVPRYNTAKETETYNMSGSMLTTTDAAGNMSVAHRGEKIDRKADRQFYTRQGGDFARIIRKGGSPADYTWEVTDKQGTKYTYGGNGGILKGTVTDIAGQTREVISEWKLSRVEETHGDWIEYSYATADEPVKGGLTAKALYLAEARAGNRGEQAHTVVAFESNSQKELKTNNARYGFLASSNKLLDKLTVNFQGSALRSYTFTYKKGAFFKETLAEIKQLDDNGNEFAHQKFDYYDDVRDGDNYKPFKTNTETWNTGNDNLSANFINPIANMGLENFSDKASAMGGSKTNSRSASLYAGVGAINGDLFTKSGTIGGSFAYSRSDTKGISTLVDINGDGLPDKVFQAGNNLFYRPQIMNNETAEAVYGDPIRIEGINRFSEVTGSSTSGGAQAAIGWGFLTAMAGKDFESSKTETKTYFSDVNGDGLIDIVSNGKVYFNRIKKDGQGNLVPSFTLQSSETPSPIMGGGTISSGDMNPTPEEQEEAVKFSPMQDVVRVWEAPFDGTISIDGTVQLQLPSGDYDESAYAKADGVRVAIQKGNTELWNRQIVKGDGALHDANVTSIAVTKGQRIYFRVQSGNQRLSNGTFDEVKWNPVITYGEQTGYITPDGYTSNVYKASEGNIYSQGSTTRLTEGVALVVNGAFVKPVTSDSLTVRVFSSNDARDNAGNPNPNYREQQIYTRIFAPQETHSGDLTINLTNVDGDMNFRFEITSNTNVAWEKVSWRPVVSYTPVNGKSIIAKGSVAYSVFALQTKGGQPYQLTQTGTIQVKPTLSITMPAPTTAPNSTLTVAVKAIDKLLAKKTFPVINGQLPVDALLEFTTTEPLGIWVEYFLSEPVLASFTSMAQATITPSITGTPIAVDANLFTIRSDREWGMMYRGWGQFVYNTADERYARPIEEALLKLPESEEDKPDPLTMAFVPMSLDTRIDNQWIGAHDQIRIANEIMQASRMGDPDVTLTNPFDGLGNAANANGDCLQGTSAFGITLLSKSTSKANLYGAAGVTRSESEGKSRVESNFQDMNGDGYPDIITTRGIQFTNTQGGFEGEILRGVGSNRGESKSTTWSYGGNPVHAAQITAAKLQGAGKLNADKTSSDNAKNGATSLSISLGNPVNEDWAVESIQDVNGDGLPDKILEDKRVMINLGYAFTQPVDWQLERIQGGKSVSYNGGLGLGVSIGASSISGGFGLVTTVSNEHYNLSDVNSDGLPDKVWQDGNNIMVSLNKGNTFDAPMIWKGASMLSKSASTSESANVGFTVNIPIVILGIKISINPGVSVSQSMNRNTYELRDVDGDGYLDIVTSDKDSEMTVTRSAIGRTNMLRSVTNSLGGRFELDYKRTVPTYDNPGSKWVLAEVTTDDGIRDDGPAMKTRFDYADGRRDRHEREFLGFGKVIAQSINTENSDAVYRTSIQKYDVSSYYTQGRLLKSRVEDAAGNPFAETVNEYDVYKIKATADNYTFTKETAICSDRGSAFVPLRYTANKQFEGQAQGMTTSEAWNEYYLDGYFGELKSYKYSDKGALGANGSGAFDYQTAVVYGYNRNKHILGLPTEVTVSGSGQTYRRITAAYDMNHADHITKITQDLGGQTAVTDFTYDPYGNITKKTLPANAKGQRMWYQYRYEPVMTMYVERVSDAFGYRSEVENFDYRYGVGLRHRDLNNFYSETEIDNRGRIVKVTGPNELADGKAYTIKFEYDGNRAVTTHYDKQHPDKGIETVTFVDGFGRAVQVKKTGVLTNGNTDSEVMIVSGRVKFDAFGRAKEAYHPVTEPTGNKLTFNPAFDAVTPTKTTYDVLDRTLTVTRPDNAVTTMQYGTDTGTNSLTTTVTDAMGGKQTTYAQGKQTVKTEQFGGPNGVITTLFNFDGIGQLLKVTDAKGGETHSVYDMAGRRTQVTHPASGTTNFVYDNASNLLSKQTANLLEKGKMITYEYDYNRLTAITYPDHPENNVKYTYGGVNASHNRIGRLMLMEDGTGAQEYFYGKMGEITKVRRTMIIPNQAIATYVTQWTYDSFNRLLEMIYPDEEKVTYSYNVAGLLNHVKGSKAYSYDYVNKIGYDKFEQRNYIKYCNGVETNYTYDEQTRRLNTLDVLSNKIGKQLMTNAYTYDKVDNVLSVSNTAPLPDAGKLGGQMRHTYTYDGLYRLISATGNYTGNATKTAGYTLNMAYDNLHNIVSKKQFIAQKDVQFNGTLKAGYELAYNYANTQQIGTINDVNYRTDVAGADLQSVPKTNETHAYQYDKNGNLIYVNTARQKADGTVEQKNDERKLLWDEENRLLAIDDNGFVSNYWYDAAGERTVKTSGDGEAIYVNSLFSGGRTGTQKFTAYISPYLVVSQAGAYTKHIYIGSQRIVSKLGDLQSW